MELAIHPYLYQDIWWFKDRRLRVKEKLLNNKDLFCYIVAKGRTRFTIIYSLELTPQTNVTMELVETGVKPGYAEDPDERGSIYLPKGLPKEYDNLRCYFCSNILKWFDAPPPFIYLQVK